MEEPKYIAQHWSDYPGTGLPVYQVYLADEYSDASKPLRPVGEIWITGVRGVTGHYMPTGWRWQLAGTGPLAASDEYALTSYQAAVRDGVSRIAEALRNDGLY